MNEVEIKFEREDRDGIVAVGTYLADAAKRLGIDLEGEHFDEENFNVVKIIKGGDLLSAPTKEETEKLSDEKREKGTRLANHAKIEKPGELVIMTTEKKAEDKPTEEEIKEEYRKEFEALPLEKKIASLVELEAIALSETFSFVINSPYKIVGKIMDVLAEFGLKLEDEAKKQTRPEEHQTADGKPSVRETKTDDNDNKPSVSEEDKDDEIIPSVSEENEDENDSEPSVSEEGMKTPRGKKSEPLPPSV